MLSMVQLSVSAQVNNPESTVPDSQATKPTIGGFDITLASSLYPSKRVPNELIKPTPSTSSSPAKLSPQKVQSENTGRGCLKR
jgi:hypothetical protein